MTGNWSDEETDNPHPTATPGKFLRVTRSCRYYGGQQHGYEQGLTPLEPSTAILVSLLTTQVHAVTVSCLSLRRGLEVRSGRGSYKQPWSSVVVEAAGPFHQNLFR
jgi:hypothetical protein